MKFIEIKMVSKCSVNRHRTTNHKNNLLKLMKIVFSPAICDDYLCDYFLY